MVSEMNEKAIFYRVVDCCEDSYYQLITNWDIDADPDYIAQDAADDFFSNHDGWEASWPLIITLHTIKGGLEKSRMIVDMEAVPTFTAQRIET